MIDDKLNKALQAAFSIGCQVGALDKDYKTSGVKYIPTGEIADIKQAFRDSKWLEPNTDRYALQEAMNKAISEQPEFKMPIMTGQEWYDRFEREKGYISQERAYQILKQEGVSGIYNLLMEAAKKAAGL